MGAIERETLKFAHTPRKWSGLKASGVFGDKKFMKSMN
jgi:hypothetical protein